MLVEIFTDGACRGNPGPGGWGVVLRCKGQERQLSGAEAHTTNNRMELTAAIHGLQALTKPCTVDLYTDSEYVKHGINVWIKRWQQTNWRNSAGKPVKNKDLWQLLEQALAQHQVTWHWVKGHSGHPENELADSLARAAIDKDRD